MASILSNRIAQVETIKLGMGLQYLLDAAHKILGNPLLMHNMEYQLIAYCKNVATDDPIWEEIVRSGMFSEQTIEFFKAECFIDEVANAQNLALLKSDKLKHDRCVGKVYSVDGIAVANAIVVASTRPFEPYDFVLFEAVCNALSKEISTIAHYREYAYQYQDAMIAKLINREIRDRALFAGHVANLYGDSLGNLFVGVVDIEQWNTDCTGLACFRDLLKQTEPAYKYTIYLQHIVMIMSSERETLSKRRDLHRLDKLFRQKNIYAGVSDCFDNIYELAEYYDRAVSTLRAGREDPGGQRIFFYDKKKLRR